MKYKILLIEDNESDAFFFEELLLQISAIDFSLTIEKRMNHAIGRLKSEKFDIIFTDLGLPDSFGLATLKHIYEQEKIVPIVVLTGLNDQETGFQALNFGAQDYLIKGELTADQIYRVIRYSIGRKGIQEKFIESERRFRMLFESSPIGIGIIDVDGRFESLNEYGQDCLGCTFIELYRLNLFEIIVDSAAGKEVQTILNDTGCLLNFEVELKSLTGELRYYNLNSTPTTSPLIKTFLLVIEDITNKKNAQKQLILQNTALDSAANSIIITDTNARIVWVNKAFTHTTGYTFDEVIGKNPNILKSGLHNQAFYEKLWHTILSDHVWSGEIINKGKNGQLLIEYVTITPVYDDKKHLSYFVAIRQDLTRQKEAEAALRESELKYRSLFENSQDSIIIISNDMRFRDVNQAFLKLSGYTEAEISLLTAANLFAAGSEMEVIFRMSSERGYITNLQAAIIRKDGTMVDILLSANTRVGNDREVYDYEFIIKDITDVVNTRRDLEVALDLAQEANKLKSNFLAQMSHELRTPMNGILGYIDIIMDEYPEQEIISYIRGLSQSANRLKETLILILEMTELSSSKYNEKLMRINILPLMNRYLESIKGICKEKKLKLEINTSESEIFALISERMFFASVKGLLDNAIKYTDSGNIYISIEKVVIDGNPVVQITVQDTGIGIPEDALELIFEPFRQVSEGWNRNFEGTGLGLAIAKRYIEYMNGTVHVTSQLGSGSTFTIRLPEILPKSNLSTQNLLTGESAVLDLIPDGIKILLVEDDEASIEVTKFYLSMYSPNVDVALNGREAVEYCYQHKFDAILMDINLGYGLNGVETAKEIRTAGVNRETPILALTAYAYYSDKEKFLNNGMQGFLAKPFLKRDLISGIADILKS